MQPSDAANRFVEDVKIELMRVTQNEENSQDAFLVYGDLETIWSRSRVKTLLRLFCLNPENRLDQEADIVLQHYLKIISILIRISWMQWPKFSEIFLGNQTTWNEARKLGRHDDSLPFTPADLRSLLGTYGMDFNLYQWFFLPIRIGERRSKSYVDYTHEYRLPVLGTAPLEKGASGVVSPLLGGGASGVVYRETIAPGCLASSDGSWNAKSIEVARKHITTPEDFESESVVIERLKNNSLSHRHITRCYGVVVRQGKHEKQLDIFYELASCNLSQFLRSCGDVPPSIEMQCDVLAQTFGLIGALVLCHEQFYDPDQGRVVLAHNDLKPENILVFSNAESKDSLVGAWKIADFGLSKIKQVTQDRAFFSPESHTAVFSNQDFSMSKAIRPPGGYTAPEIVREGSLLEGSSSVQCDLWSLGCILAQILVFAVGGSQALKRFNDLRAFDYRDDRYFEYHGEELRFKRPLFEVLMELYDPSAENNWEKQFVDLVLDILRVDKDTNGHGKILGGSRPKASAIRDEFRKIQQSHKSRPQSSVKSPERLGEHLPRGSVSTISTSHTEPESNIVGEYRKPSSWSSVPPSFNDDTSSNSEPASRGITLPSIRINDQQRPVVQLPSERDQHGVGSSQATSPASSNGPVLPVSPGFLPVRPSSESPAINISCKTMKAVQLSHDATIAAFWSDTQVVVYSLSSAVREQIFDFHLAIQPRRKITAIKIFESTLAITFGAPKSDEIKFFNIMDRQKKQKNNLSCVTLRLGETDRFLRVLLGINNTVILVYTNCLRIGTLRDSTSLEDFKTINLKSETAYFFQPSTSLIGNWLVVCSRDPKVPQTENWHFRDLSASQEAVTDMIIKNLLPTPDIQGPTAPSLMIPFRDTVGVYYRTGGFALFEGIEHGCQLPKNIKCAAVSGPVPGLLETQILVYVIQYDRIFLPKTEIWCTEIHRYGSGGRVTSKKPVHLLEIPGKLKQTSVGFNWVKEDEKGPRLFCVFVAFHDGSIRCLKLPGVMPRWLD